jgi:hypothetical protein
VAKQVAATIREQAGVKLGDTPIEQEPIAWVRKRLSHRAALPQRRKD